MLLLACLATSTACTGRRTIELSKGSSVLLLTDDRIGEPMRYRVIAAALGATPLLAMGAMAEPSAKSSYGVDGAGTTVTQGPAPTTMTSKSFSPADKATPRCGFTSQC
jgi:hypothetical protein